MNQTPACPECGGEPTEDSQLQVQLAELGYGMSLTYICTECDTEWDA